MTRLPSVFALLLAVASGGLLAAQPPTATKEPTHDGKTLSEWVKQLGGGDEKAAAALRTLAAQSDRVAEKVLAAAADPATRRPLLLIEVLIDLGPAAVPALTQGIWSDDVRLRRTCLFALDRIGPDARPAAASVARLLADPAPAV